MKRELRTKLIAALALGWGVAAPSFAAVMETFSNSSSQMFDGNVFFSSPLPTAGLARIPIPVAFSSGNGIIEKVLVKLEFMKCETDSSCESQDGFFEEIVFRLINPSDTQTVGLIEPVDPNLVSNFPPAGSFEITFDDDVIDPIDRSMLEVLGGGRYTAAPDAGFLGSFNGEMADGTWWLAVGDTSRVGGPLTFMRIDLTITVGDGVPTGQAPEPGTLALLGLGVLGLGALARRK